MRYIDGIPVWADPVDEGALTQIKVCAQSADYVALMGDSHKGYAMPVGGVWASTHAVSVNGVGFDIGCGNKAVLTDATYADIQKDLPLIMDTIWANLSFGVGLNNNQRVEHELFDPSMHPAWKIRAVWALRQKAQNQLGTIGSGNHYVDLLRDEQDRIWIGCHFGSRGFGHGIATHFLKAGGARDGMDVPPLVLEADSNLGSEYLQAMQLAGEYAYTGRDWVCDQVAKILGVQVLESVHNHHNYAWRETHFGQEMWVVRKGATPAFPGQLGFVGATMNEPAVILRGVASEESDLTLNSTVHGAGRTMSRTQAKKQFTQDDYRAVRAAVELRGAGLDELPGAYKRLADVLAQHISTVEILHTLAPIGVAMAGPEVKDPFRD